MHQLINLTTHDVNVEDEKGNTLFTVPKYKGEVENLPRVTTSVSYEMGRVEVDGVVYACPWGTTQWGRPINYPQPRPGVRYIVSYRFIDGCLREGLEVSHLCSPGTLLRDEEGRVRASIGLAPQE